MTDRDAMIEAMARAFASRYWEENPSYDILPKTAQATLERAIAHALEAAEPFIQTSQKEVDAWMDACFGEPIKSDQLERADRFCEEALELCQTMPGFTADRAHALVDYVFSRDQGEIAQEVGGVMVTLAALCNTRKVDIADAMRTEIARIWTKVEQIRAKQATKPVGSALPIAITRNEHREQQDG